MSNKNTCKEDRKQENTRRKMTNKDNEMSQVTKKNGLKKNRKQKTNTLW